MIEKQKVLKERILGKLDLSRNITDEQIWELIEEEILQESRSVYMSLREKRDLGTAVFNSIRKLDILQELIDDNAVTEIMVNGPKHVFVEKDGKLCLWGKSFESRDKLEDVIQQMVSGANRIINEANPIVDVRLKNGSRVNVVLNPIAIDGPMVTIRKFPEENITMDKLLDLGSINEEASEFLKKLVIAKYNIFISGGTSTGKTTFLNVLSNFIPEDERIITIEDSAELQINNIPNLVRLEVRNANVDGSHEITIRDLIKASLRMRPDRIVIGEVRDAAAIDMLAALNTGHDGSLSTGHANSPADMLGRLESLVLTGMDIPLTAVRRQISSAIDIIVHLGRLRDRSRKVLEIVEVLDCINGEIQINPIYEFQETGVNKEGRILGGLVKTSGTLKTTGKLNRAGLNDNGLSDI